MLDRRRSGGLRELGWGRKNRAAFLLMLWNSASKCGHYGAIRVSCLVCTRCNLPNCSINDQMSAIRGFSVSQDIYHCANCVPSRAAWSSSRHQKWGLERANKDKVVLALV
ncbi:hypothetical protein IQ06DRAFT_117370 [Phaeosphaeriaceae sp. SRC1lsM3a]|nr:hypothetical protein IQ06DRAFT_117370 [Stagonospora sp. SRC1lsM3a]